MISKTKLRPCVEEVALKKQRCLLEVKNINAQIMRGARDVAIFYDNLVSPPSYGDFLHVVMLARIFNAKGLNVTFFIINNAYRDDWRLLGNNIKIYNMVKEQEKLARIFIDRATIKVESWEELKRDYGHFIGDNYVIPFRDLIINRKPIYNHSFCLISQLLNDVKIEKNNAGLFLCKNNISINHKSLPNPYITWHCRYSEKWSIDRNLTEKEFNTIYEFLRSKFKNHSLLIISDDLGCKQYKMYAERCNYEILFSKDYSSEFLGDAKLILGSEFYFALRGGGISSIAIYSNIPYMIICPIVHDISWKSGQYVPWQTKKQVFIEANILIPEILSLTENIIKNLKIL